MSILGRFQSIVSANINALLDRAEDPSKMIDQYLRDLSNDLAAVKRETAGVMAEEARTKRLWEENRKDVLRFTELAQKALLANNEGDARIFLAKKQDLEAVGEGIKKAYETAQANAAKMRQMHDKLVADINSLNARRQAIKATVAVARTQQRLTNVSGAASTQAMDAFSRAEAKANEMLDRANAMAQLNDLPIDEAVALEAKYASAQQASAVDSELEEMKRKLGLVKPN